MTPLKEKKLLANKDIAAIFSNVETLKQLHSQTSQEYDRKKSSNPVVEGSAKPLLENIDKLKQYAIYCSNQPTGMAHLRQLRQKDSNLEAFFKECQRNPECRNLDVAPFLAKPFQRITKYPLLLRVTKIIQDFLHF